VPFSRVLYIEQDDFREDAPRKFFRLKPGGEVRVRYAYIIKCEEVVKDEQTGEIIELRCTCDMETLGKQPEDRKVKGVIHWVSAAHAAEVEVRLYDRLFTKADPDDLAEGEDYKTHLNPDSLQILRGCVAEPGLAAAQPGDRFQFERLGYFCVDSRDSQLGAPVFNRTVSLRDTWAKIEKSETDQ
jgi:glutaminyl-tRNA synthetase